MSPPSNLPHWHPLPPSFRTLAASIPGSVLLETAKFSDENHRSLLFLHPLHELTASTPQEAEAALRAIDEHTALGRYAAGFVAYECGELFNGLAPRATPTPLLRIGIFSGPITFDHGTGALSGSLPTTSAPTDQPAAIETSTFDISSNEYAGKIRRIHDYLARGHSYQVNFTDRFTGTFRGSPLALYSQLIAQQPVAYAAFINIPGNEILSLSPELFFHLRDQILTARPMKGTWPRGVDLPTDALAADALHRDPKNRAEHVTIVDLLRNDLGKVCTLGSVHVTDLMRVERYPTLHQMTSTIQGTLASNATATQAFRELFPSGSITGAPKHRTMEIIRELERHPRGVYTGSIGYFGPGNSAHFSVAIRTLQLHANRFTLGVGGGITVSSTAASEYNECLLKASFLTAQSPTFNLIETMRARHGRIRFLDAHLTRLQESATYFGIPISTSDLRTTLTANLPSETSRVRLTVNRNGDPTIETTPLDHQPWSGRILLSPNPTDPTSPFFHHKTSHRHLYNDALREARALGFDEVLFLNTGGLVTEGSISNLFLRINGHLATPATAAGVLPGILRSRILQRLPQTELRPITLDELQTASRIWVCSALRGIRPVLQLEDTSGRLLWARSR